MLIERSEPIAKNTTWLKFIAGSTVGALCFLFPVRDGDVVTIPIALASNNLTEYLGDLLPLIVIAIVTISAVLSLWFSLRRSAAHECPGYLGTRRLQWQGRLYPHLGQ